MASLYITTFHGAAEVAMGDPQQEMAVTIGATSTQSVPMTHMPNRRHWRVRLWADVDCFVKWGENPEAKQDGTSGMPLAAKSAEYFDVESDYKFAVIEKT